MGLQIPGYTIAGKLGEGGFAVVWAATGPGGAAVALEVANNPTELSRRRLGAEADAMEAIGPDFAPQVIERGALAGGRPYVAMERLFGRSLAAHLGAGPLPLARAGELAEVIAAAIAATAAAGYVHADLKPANIVVLAAPTAKVRLIDFGLARRIGSEDPGGETIAGTAAYMAPEQLRGEALTAATDVYGFGAVLFEMLAGRPPFVGDRPEIERGHLALRPPHPGSLRPLPESIAALCLACLAKVPAARPAIDGLGEAIAAAFGDVGEEPEAARSPTPAGMTTIAAARQPVVLLVIDGAPRAESEVRRLGGVVARRGGDRLVCGFTGGAGDPAGAALEGARAAVALGGRAALHLANLRVRGEPPSIYGREVERPETWMPDSETPSYLPLKGGGLNSAAAISTTETLEQILPAGGEDRRAIELVGRDAELEAAEASWRAVLETRTPGLFTALAGRGLGKSRLAAELAARLESDAAVTLGRGGGDDADLVARLSALRGGTAEPAAVIVDDLHLGSDALLDAVERAALDAVDTPLWIAACADPALLTRRRQWGLRAARAASVELGPLAREPARELAAALLRPAESPPAATLDRLVDWAGANPFYLRELARSLERAGVIRRRGASHYVATAALDALSALPVGQWLATRELDELPEELAAAPGSAPCSGRRFTATSSPTSLTPRRATAPPPAPSMSTSASPSSPSAGLSAAARAGSSATGLWRPGWPISSPTPTGGAFTASPSSTGSIATTATRPSRPGPATHEPAARSSWRRSRGRRWPGAPARTTATRPPTATTPRRSTPGPPTRIYIYVAARSASRPTGSTTRSPISRPRTSGRPRRPSSSRRRSSWRPRWTSPSGLPTRRAGPSGPESSATAATRGRERGWRCPGRGCSTAATAGTRRSPPSRTPSISPRPPGIPRRGSPGC
jgi:hypothetical protein